MYVSEEVNSEPEHYNFAKTFAKPPNSSRILSNSKLVLVWRKPQPEVIIEFQILGTKVRWVNTEMFKVTKDVSYCEIEL